MARRQVPDSRFLAREERYEGAHRTTSSRDGRRHRYRRVPAGAGSANEYTPLAWAAAYGHTDTVHLLLERGADINAKTGWGVTACWLATVGKHIPVLRELLDHGAEIDVILYSGKTALAIAAEKGYVETVRFLLQRGANPEIAGHQTALMYAASGGRAEVVQILLEHGVNVNAVYQQEPYEDVWDDFPELQTEGNMIVPEPVTARSLARKWKRPVVEEILRQAGGVEPGDL